jgi:hypothetical protein
MAVAMCASPANPAVRLRRMDLSALFALLFGHAKSGKNKNKKEKMLYEKAKEPLSSLPGVFADGRDQLCAETLS